MGNTDSVLVRVTREVTFTVEVDVRWVERDGQTVPVVEDIYLPYGLEARDALKTDLLGSVHAGSAEIVEGVRGLDEERRNADGAE